MTKLTLQGLWARKRRLIGSFLAVFLGVAFLCGTLVLSDTLSSSVDRFFTQAYTRTDVVIRNATSATDDSSTPRGMIPRSVLDRVRQVSGVACSTPSWPRDADPVRRTWAGAGRWSPAPARMLSAVATVLPTAYTGAPGYYRSSKPNISLRAYVGSGFVITGGW